MSGSEDEIKRSIAPLLMMFIILILISATFGAPIGAQAKTAVIGALSIFELYLFMKMLGFVV